MKKLIFVLAILVIGCIPLPSINTIVSDEYRVFEPELLGSWASIERPNPSEYYEFTEMETDSVSRYRIVENFYKNSDTSQCSATLVRIDDEYWLDFEFDFDDEETGTRLMDLGNLSTMTMLPVHNFCRVDSFSPSLTLSIFNPDWLSEYAGRHPSGIVTLSAANPDLPVFTGSLEEMQGFLIQYGHDDNLFVPLVTLMRTTEIDN